MSVESIRQAERKSHEEIYSTAKLFEKGSWLQKPVKTVLDILPLFSDYKEITVLDLGSGVGRNAIPIAQFCSDKQCKLDCVDILDMAIDKLNFYSGEYGVSACINGIIASIDDFEIEKNGYDFILSVSSLEHINSETAFAGKLYEIRNGIKENGVVCLIVNSEINETDKQSGRRLEPQFEVNLKTDKLISVLENVFNGWQVLKTTVVNQRYDIPRNDCVADLTTNVVTYVVRKNKEAVLRR